MPTKKMIVIADRGWVWVGNVDLQTDRTKSETGDCIKITNSYNIRRWGTSKGLGELINGPLPGTVLDFSGTVNISRHAMIACIEVEGEKWSLP